MAHGYAANALRSKWRNALTGTVGTIASLGGAAKTVAAHGFAPLALLRTMMRLTHVQFAQPREAPVPPKFTCTSLGLWLHGISLATRRGAAA
jgi:hypothetical protein